MVAVAVGGAAVAGLAGSAISAGASKSAANAQVSADNNAAAIQQAEFNQNQANLKPYIDTGTANLGPFSNFWQTSQNQLGSVFDAAQAHVPQAMTEANLVQTPGYQFNLSQGLRAMQNSAAAKGLGVSGAALQGAGTYATGLADSTYQAQFANQQSIYNDYLQQAQLKGNQLGQIYSQISAPVTTGENAAAQAGVTGTQGASNIGNSLTAGGVANSAGITGQANALSSGVQGVGNSAITYLALQNALNNGNGGYVDNTSTF